MAQRDLYHEIYLLNDLALPTKFHIDIIGSGAASFEPIKLDFGLDTACEWVNNVTSMKTLPLLDLHGYSVADVADAVDRFLTLQIKKGASKVRIMTGKGSGQVRKATTDYLKLGQFPFEFEKLANGTRNEGVLIVHIGD